MTDLSREPVVICGWLARCAEIGDAYVAKARRGKRTVSSGPAPTRAEAFRRLRERLELDDARALEAA
ncbi:MAG: hypothetical protein ACK41D_11110 [Rubricoccaceae bacterium]